MNAAVSERELPFTVACPYTRPDGVVLLRRYEVLRKIGEGGMAVVYEGVDLNVPEQPKVAIKFLLPSIMRSGESSDQAPVKRFAYERKVAMNIHSDYTVRGIDIGLIGDEESGEVFYVMEYVNGTTLKHKIDEEKARLKPLSAVIKAKTSVIPVSTIRWIFPQICAGVRALHQAAIVHRDLKPDNFLVEMRDGVERIKLADFGISKAIKDLVSADMASENLTATGFLIGTPLYIAPEVIEGNKDPIDHRVDIWALGIILYELVTGKTPFRDPLQGEAPLNQGGDARFALCRRIVSGTPVPYESYRAPFWELNEKLLEKDPKKRPQSVDEVMELFEQLFEVPTVEARRKALPETLRPPSPSVSQDIDPALADTVLHVTASRLLPVAEEPVLNELLAPRAPSPASGKEATVRRSRVVVASGSHLSTVGAGLLMMAFIGLGVWLATHPSAFRKTDVFDPSEPSSSQTTSAVSPASTTITVSVAAPSVSSKIIPGMGPKPFGTKEDKKNYSRYKMGLDNVAGCLDPHAKQPRKSCEQAVILLRATSDTFPHFPDPLGKMGDCQRKLGRIDDACKSYAAYRMFKGVKLTPEQQTFFGTKCHGTP